jgi:hypothetical protein
VDLRSELPFRDDRDLGRVSATRAVHIAADVVLDDDTGYLPGIYETDIRLLRLMRWTVQGERLPWPADMRPGESRHRRPRRIRAG